MYSSPITIGSGRLRRNPAEVLAVVAERRKSARCFPPWFGLAGGQLAVLRRRASANQRCRQPFFVERERGIAAERFAPVAGAPVRHLAGGQRECRHEKSLPE